MGWMPPPGGIVMCQGDDAVVTIGREESMDEAGIIGVDLAEQVMQVHGAAPDGRALFRKKL